MLQCGSEVAKTTSLFFIPSGGRNAREDFKELLLCVCVCLCVCETDCKLSRRLTLTDLIHNVCVDHTERIISFVQGEVKKGHSRSSEVTL